MSTGKVALVTGAGRGIGSEIARALARDGAFVIVNYNGSRERAKAVAAEIKAAGGDAAAYGCNVADFSACEAMIRDVIKEYGRIDILVNNAGITRDGLLMKMSGEDFDAVIDTNLKGAFHTIRHASRYFLKQRSGRIINLSSVSGVMGNAGQANYRDGYDGGAFRCGKREPEIADSARTHRNRGGCRRACGVSRFRARRIYHRAGDFR